MENQLKLRDNKIKEVSKWKVMENKGNLAVKNKVQGKI